MTKIKITNFEIKILEEPLKSIAEEKLPALTTFKIVKIIKILGEELKNIEQTRLLIVKKYSNKPDKEGNFEVKPENIKDFQKEYKEILDQETEIEIDLLSINDLKDIKIKAKDLLLLDKLIRDIPEPV